MPTFYLDDQAIEFSEGETILKAVLREGVEIPHYCYHPGLQITAQCRQCLVEITDMGNGRGMPRLQASCSTPAANGMKVTINSDMAVKGQNLVNEFLLVNHPLDCPICDQAGECSLQNYAFRYGTGQSEMDYEKRVHGLRDVGSFIMLERNRCVQCSRCERFSRDIVGTHDFGVFLRSHEVTFDTYADEAITHKFQGNLADICPVGCIMNRDWRFRKRAWKLRKSSSVCAGCSTGCNITIEHHDNKVYRVKPRENAEVNRWWMCDEGRLHFRHFNDRRNRISEPLARVQGELRPAGWDAVLEALGTRLKEIAPAPQAVLGLADTQATSEELYLFKSLLSAAGAQEAPLFAQVPDGPQEKAPQGMEDTFIYSLITTDKSPNSAGAARLGLRGLPDAAALAKAMAPAKVVFILGAPLADSEELRQAVSKAELVVQIGIFRGPWSGVADIFLPAYTHAEKWGTFINRQGHLQQITPALRPPEGARDDLRILADLHAALGADRPPADAPAVFAAMAAAVPPLQGQAWEGLAGGGVVLK